MNNKIRIIKDNSLVGIGSTIFRGLHYLYYNDKADIVYLEFENALYSDPNVNVWNLFLKQPFDEQLRYIDTGEVTFEQLRLDDNPFLFCYGAAQQNGKYFEDQQKVTEFRDSLKRHIRFQDTITDKVNAFLSQKLEGAKTLSLHVRGTDQFSDTGHAQGQRHLFEYPYIKQQVDREIDNFDVVFLATDEEEIRDSFKRDFGDKIVTYSTIYAPKGAQTGLHASFIQKTAQEKYNMGEEALIDSIIMSKCDYSLYVKSNISLLSLLLKKDFSYRFIDNHINYGKLG